VKVTSLHYFELPESLKSNVTELENVFLGAVNLGGKILNLGLPGTRIEYSSQLQDLIKTLDEDESRLSPLRFGDFVPAMLMKVPLKKLERKILPSEVLVATEDEAEHKKILENFNLEQEKALKYNSSFCLDVVFNIEKDPFHFWEAFVDLKTLFSSPFLAVVDKSRDTGEHLVESIASLVFPAVFYETLMRAGSLKAKLESIATEKPETLKAVRATGRMKFKMDFDGFMTRTVVYSIPYLKKKQEELMRDGVVNQVALSFGLFTLFHALSKMRNLFELVEDFEVATNGFEKLWKSWKDLLKTFEERPAVDERLQNFLVIVSTVLAYSYFQSRLLTEELKFMKNKFEEIFPDFFGSEVWKDVVRETTLLLGTYALREEEPHRTVEEFYEWLEEKISRILETKKDERAGDVKKNKAEISKFLDFLKELQEKDVSGVEGYPEKVYALAHSVIEAFNSHFCLTSHEEGIDGLLRRVNKLGKFNLEDAEIVLRRKKERAEHLLRTSYENPEEDFEILVRVYRDNLEKDGKLSRPPYKGLDTDYYSEKGMTDLLIPENFFLNQQVARSVCTVLDLDNDWKNDENKRRKVYDFFIETFLQIPGVLPDATKISVKDLTRETNFSFSDSCKHTSYAPARLLNAVSLVSEVFSPYESYLPGKLWTTYKFLERTFEDMEELIENIAGSDSRRYGDFKKFRNSSADVLEELDEKLSRIKEKLKEDNSISVELEEDGLLVREAGRERTVSILDAVSRLLLKNMCVNFTFRSNLETVMSCSSKVIAGLEDKMKLAEKLGEKANNRKKEKKAGKGSMKKSGRKTAKSDSMHGKRIYLIKSQMRLHELVRKSEFLEEFFHVPGISIHSIIGNLSSVIAGSRALSILPFFREVVGGELGNVFSEGVPPEVLSVVSGKAVEEFVDRVARGTFVMGMSLDEALEKALDEDFEKMQSKTRCEEVFESEMDVSDVEIVSL